MYGTTVEPRRQKPIDVRAGTTLCSILESRRPLLFPGNTRRHHGDKVVRVSGHKADDLRASCHERKNVGVIIVGGRKVPEMFEEDEVNLLANVAAQTAVSIENSRLNQDMEKTYFETISALALAVDARTDIPADISTAWRIIAW